MAQYKATLLFQFAGPPVCGFSESYEFEASSVAAATAVAANLPAFRAGILSSSWQIIGYRLSAISYTYVSTPKPHCVKKYTPVKIIACISPITGALGVTDSPYAAVYYDISMVDPVLRDRRMLIRGIPDTWWDGGVLVDPCPDAGAVVVWFNAFKTAGVGKAYALPSGCSPAFIGWNAYCPKRIASRRIGRPFGLLRGRRSKKKVAP